MERTEMNAEILSEDKTEMTEQHSGINSENEENIPREQSSDIEDAKVSDQSVEYDVKNYAEIERRDMEELVALFPELYGKSRISELNNPLRYAALRDLGLTPKEAFLATNGHLRHYDTRSHLVSAVPARAEAASNLLGKNELESARELFSGLSDREIQKLYKKVTK